jgi:hypothetical protein
MLHTTIQLTHDEIFYKKRTLCFVVENQRSCKSQAFHAIFFFISVHILLLKRQRRYVIYFLNFKAIKNMRKRD